ncbi:MAG: DNA repair protein RecO [Gammaproteobacteria bacterium]|nr:DNA repair protein RecO [Gammaproteobacteria bacterium]
MKVNRQPAYVLHARPYAESSLLVDVFSRDHGRCMLLAKGARRRKGGQRGILMPFKPLLIGWSGKGALPVLTAAEATAHLPEIAGFGLHAGLYANELLLKLLHRFDGHEKLYFAYDVAVQRLASGADPGETLRIFEKQFLREIGFGLILDHDVETGKAIDPSVQYVYLPQSGPVASPAGSPGITVRGATLRELDGEEFRSQKSRSEARQLIRELIRHQLGGRELRSRRVFRQLLLYQGKGKGKGKRTQVAATD